MRIQKKGVEIVNVKHVYGIALGGEYTLEDREVDVYYDGEWWYKISYKGEVEELGRIPDEGVVIYALGDAINGVEAVGLFPEEGHLRIELSGIYRERDWGLGYEDKAWARSLRILPNGEVKTMWEWIED